MNVDKIILSGVEFYAYGGVTEAEKRIGQRYRVSVELHVDVRRAAQTDAVEDTIHYGEVCETIIATAREAPFNLIETAATRIADQLLERFPAESVTIRLEKLLPPIDAVVRSAAVEITRQRR